MTFGFKSFKRSLFDLPDIQAIQTPQGRRYATPEGILYPSVTTVLYHRPNEGLDAWRKRVGEEEAAKISKTATDHGENVHSLCEAYLKEDQRILERLTPLQKTQLSYWRPVLNRIDNIRGVEQALWSDKLKIAGRADLIADYAGKPSVCDWKTSKRTKKPEHIQSYFIQGTAYSLMVEELTGEVFENIVVAIYIQSEAKIQVVQESRKRFIEPLYELVESYYQEAA